MNSIDNVLARIQEIINRVHEIQAAQGRVTGFGPGTAATGPKISGGAAPTAAAGGISSGAAIPSSGANNVEFQKLLQSALAAEGSTLGGGAGGSGTLLSGLGNLGSLGNALGSDLGVTPSSGNSIAQYQQELVKAIRELAAQKKNASNPPQ